MLAAFALAGAAYAGGAPVTAELVEVFDDIRPVYVTHAPGDFDRLFVVGQCGKILIIDEEGLEDVPFLDIGDLLATVATQGLLCVAFHPDYDTNGYFYVNYIRHADGANVLARYEVSADPDVADPDSELVMMVLPQPAINHNADWIGFGPDCYLYYSIGDGGNGFDGGDDGQNINSLLGKILRIDPDGDDFSGDPDRNYAIPPDNPFVGVDGADEVWAYGIRQPWRCSFDRLTGDFYIGDVGHSEWEEVDFQPAASMGGENYGWDCKEATHCTTETTCDCEDETLVDPIFEYPHDILTSTSLIGGYVYRGSAMPSLDGAYFFALRRIVDGGKVWAARHDGTSVTELEEIQGKLDAGDGHVVNAVSTFGEDAAGEIYVCTLEGLSGKLFKLVPGPGCDGDCGTFDGVVDVVDLLVLFGAWGVDSTCDIDGDGFVDTADMLAMFAQWGSCR